jgi:hypothetical protein
MAASSTPKQRRRRGWVCTERRCVPLPSLAVRLSSRSPSPSTVAYTGAPTSTASPYVARVKSGRQLVASNTFDRKGGAEAWEREQRRALAFGEFIPPTRSAIRFFEVAEKFLESRRGQISPHSWRTDRDNLANVPPLVRRVAVVVHRGVRNPRLLDRTTLDQGPLDPSASPNHVGLRIRLRGPREGAHPQPDKRRTNASRRRSQIRRYRNLHPSRARADAQAPIRSPAIHGRRHRIPQPHRNPLV